MSVSVSGQLDYQRPALARTRRTMRTRTSENRERRPGPCRLALIMLQIPSTMSTIRTIARTMLDIARTIHGSSAGNLSTPDYVMGSLVTFGEVLLHGGTMST